MDIKNTLEVVDFVSETFAVAAEVIEDGKVNPFEVATQGGRLVRPSVAAVKDFQLIPKEILDIDGAEYESLKASVEKAKSNLDKFLAVARKKKS